MLYLHAPSSNALFAAHMHKLWHVRTGSGGISVCRVPAALLQLHLSGYVPDRAQKTILKIAENWKLQGLCMVVVL